MIEEEVSREKTRNEKNPIHISLTEDEFDALYDYIGDLLIARFLKESEFEF